MDLSPYRTAIVTAAESADMTTRSTVKAELEITGNDSDAKIDALIGQASSACTTYLNRKIAEETVTDYFRSGRSSRSAGALWLSRWPVSSIASVVEDGTTVDPADYELNEETGQLWRLSGGDDRACWPATKTAVTYTGGYLMVTDLPWDLERAALTIIRAQWFSGKRDPFLKGETVPGVLSSEYWVGAVGDVASIPPEAASLLDPYRRISI